MLPTGSVERPSVGGHWPVVLLALLAAGVALLAHEVLYPALSWNRDEPVYLWHADALRAGFLTPPDGGHPSLFQPWLSGHADHGFFSQYALGWPLVLLAATLTTGTSAAALPLGAALAAAGTYLLGIEVLRDRRTAILGTLLVVVSPIFAIQSGAYLSYIFTLGLGLLHVVLLLAGCRLQRTGHLVAAGAVLGWILLTRPFDAVLWGIASAGSVLLIQRRPFHSMARSTAIAGLAALPFVVLAAAYNRRITGSWSELPITAVDPLDTFGFGDRRLMPGFEIVRYDLASAVYATAKNLFLLPWFLAGTYVALIVAAWVIWRGRREAATGALLLIGAVFPLGYFAFWGNHLSSRAARISGPIYLVPLYAPICLLVAAGLMHLWSTRRPKAVLVGLAVVVATVPAAVSRLALNREISDRQRPWQTSVADLEEPALVFVADSGPYLLHFNPFSRNAVTLDGPVLYASAGSPEMLQLIAEQPSRRPFLQQASLPTEEVGPREDPLHLAVRLVPITVRRGATLDLDLTVNAPADMQLARLEVSSPNGTQVVERRRVVVGTVGSGVDIELAGWGALAVTAELDRAGSPDAPVLVRTTYVYRVVDGQVEVLDPPTLERWSLIPETDRFEWRDDLMLPELKTSIHPR